MQYNVQQQQTHVVTSQPITGDYNSTSSAVVVPRMWSYRLCSCCQDTRECCYAFWCPFCYWCTLSERLDENICGVCCCGDAFAVALRTKLRTLRGIEGSVFEDAMVVRCCPCCAGIQMSRELKTVGR